MTPTDVHRELQVDVALQWSTGYDRGDQVVRQRHRHPQGRDARHRVRAGPDQDPEPRSCARSRLLKNGDEPARHRRRAGGPYRGDRGAAARAAVRGPDQGGARYPGRLPDRGRRGVEGARRPSSRPVAGRCKQQARAVLEKGGVRREGQDRGPGSTGTTSAANPRWPLSALPRQAGGLPSAPTTAASRSSSKATPRSAPRSWPGTLEFQALLPIRGKILNVQKASLADMLKNAECAAIIQVIGAGSGAAFDLDAARYQRVIFMADADVDGAHIRTLLLTLFHRYLRPMLMRTGVRRGAAAAPDRASARARGSRSNATRTRTAELHRRCSRGSGGASAGRSPSSGTRAWAR